MRKIFLLAGMSLFVACNNTQTKEEVSTSPNSAATAEPAYAYPVNYGVASLGDLKHTETIINIWKDFDEGNVMKQKEMFADSAEFHTWDGYAYKGPRDSIMKKGQDYRNTFSAVSSSPNGIISFSAPYKPTGQTQNWVAIWGLRIYTDKNGKKDSLWLHEAWKINGAGKVDALYQFYAKATPL